MVLSSCRCPLPGDGDPAVSSVLSHGSWVCFRMVEYCFFDDVCPKLHEAVVVLSSEVCLKSALVFIEEFVHTFM